MRVEKEKAFCHAGWYLLCSFTIFGPLFWTGKPGVSFNYYERWLVERAGVHYWYCTWTSATNFSSVIILNKAKQMLRGEGLVCRDHGIFLWHIKSVRQPTASVCCQSDVFHSSSCARAVFGVSVIWDWESLQGVLRVSFWLVRLCDLLIWRSLHLHVQSAPFGLQ